MYNAFLHRKFPSQKPSKFRGSSITISAIFGNFGISGNLRLPLLFFILFLVASWMFFKPFCRHKPGLLFLCERKPLP